MSLAVKYLLEFRIHYFIIILSTIEIEDKNTLF